DVSKIRSLISEGMNMSNKIDNGQTAMHIAAEEGNIGMIKLLLDDGVSPNIVDGHFSTPFHVTAQTGREDIAQILIESGAKINARNIQAWTPLHYAALWGHAKFIELLMSCGADVDVYDLNGCTPLHIAALNGKVDAVQRLIEFGAYIFANDNKGLTPYDYARLSTKLLVLVLLFGFMTASLLVVFNQIYTSLQFYNRLRKGDSIGHGHFSDVYKGELLPIIPCFKTKRVAIKSVKNCNETDSKLTGTTELLAEINIVKRLPKHPNVVRFIGAVTKNPLEGEIKIVYEFCPYGDLKSFLKKNRQSAVDQKQTTSSQCGSKANATGIYGAKAERIDEEEGTLCEQHY
ncbi:ankyrin repeat and protein kinase domain-containing protein 1-like, partial [Sitodiplosis mosellana]|uniref:ankyrin repeat and protein kinase domain-containing protein 1-like n=1 Tax=Sitodiplosis mosellana TaxID=263140 RepID=UPI00244432DE